jgi:hypothetical protein
MLGLFGYEPKRVKSKPKSISEGKEQHPSSTTPPLGDCLSLNYYSIKGTCQAVNGGGSRDSPNNSVKTQKAAEIHGIIRGFNPGGSL